jgi:hypothetical protein
MLFEPIAINLSCMKRVFSLLTAITLLTAGTVTTSKAQVNVNVNIGVQPLWGPVGYDVAEYYYLPDVQAYYYVPRHQFIYLNGGNWVFAYNLPVAYRSYDLYSGYKVVINEPRPYLHFASHKVKYAKYKGWKGKQGAIRDSRDPKYYVVKGHPGHGGGNAKVGGSGGSHGGGKGGSPGGHGGGKGHGKGKH